MENTRACKRDNNTVYIAGNETGYLIIVKSTDRGITWQNPIEHSSLANYQVRALGCIPRSEGDILLLQGFRAGYEVAIFRSENGGVSWEKILAYPSGSISYPYRYFYKLATVNRVITSIMVDGDLRILSSEDFGKTWTLRYTVNHPNGLINQLSIVEGDNNLILGDVYGTSTSPTPLTYRIARSLDGGITWSGVSFNNLSSYLGEFVNISMGRLANGILYLLGSFTASTYNFILCYSGDNGANFMTRVINNYPYVVSSIATQNNLVFSTNDNKIYRFPYESWASGSPTQVATTTYPIYDFVGFESS